MHMLVSRVIWEAALKACENPPIALLYGETDANNEAKMANTSRFFSSPGQSFFLFGPRGTGKTTYISTSYAKMTLIDLLAPDIIRQYSARPERLKEVVFGSNNKIIVLDEVQRLPEILTVVHQLIEQDKSLTFVLTGSSSRKLKRMGVDLLAGRALTKTLHPFMASELGRDFELDKSLALGMLPLILNAKEPSETLKGYVALYLKEEVKAEGLVRNIGDFSRFLETISFSHGSLLNTSQVARDAEVSRKTVEGYVEILEDLLLSFRLQVFSKKAKRHLISRPKFYYFDAGIFNSLRPRGPLDKPEEITGATLEGLIAQHLRAWIDYRSKENQLYFWRTKSGTEVDFVIYGDDGIIAIEVKNNSRVQSRDLRGLRTFSEDYPMSKCILVYRGKEELQIDDIYCVPCELFLSSLCPSKPIFTPK